jgi:hypothetical protein
MKIREAKNSINLLKPLDYHFKKSIKELVLLPHLDRGLFYYKILIYFSTNNSHKLPSLLRVLRIPTFRWWWL